MQIYTSCACFVRVVELCPSIICRRLEPFTVMRCILYITFFTMFQAPVIIQVSTKLSRYRPIVDLKIICITLSDKSVSGTVLQWSHIINPAHALHGGFGGGLKSYFAFLCACVCLQNIQTNIELINLIFGGGLPSDPGRKPLIRF